MDSDSTNIFEIPPDIKFKLDTEPLFINNLSISGIESQSVTLLAPELRTISNSNTYVSLIENIRSAKDV